MRKLYQNSTQNHSPVAEGINKWGKEALLSLETIKQEN